MDALHLDLGSTTADRDTLQTADDVDDADVQGSTEEIETEIEDAGEEIVAAEATEVSTSIADTPGISNSPPSYRATFIDPVDAFTGGVIATRRYDSSSSSSASESAFDSLAFGSSSSSSSPLAIRRGSVESTLSASSVSSQSSLAEERSGAVMAEHLDTFSGAFTSENYQSASAYVGRHRSSPGVIHRLTGFLGGFQSGAHTENISSVDGSISHVVVQSHGEATPEVATSSTTQQHDPIAALKEGNSSSTSSSSASEGGEEEFRVCGTNIDNPQLSSHPALALPEDSIAIGIIGRDIDEPQAVVKQLVSGLQMSQAPWHKIYFQPMVIPSKELHKTDCRQYLQQGKFHMLLMCYNTTETRLMLTSPTGGYYRHVLPFAQREYGKFSGGHVRTMSCLLVAILWFVRMCTACACVLNTFHLKYLIVPL